MKRHVFRGENKNVELPMLCLIVLIWLKCIQYWTKCNIKHFLLLTADYETNFSTMSYYNEWNSQKVRSLRTRKNRSEALNPTGAVDPTNERGVYNKTKSHGNYKEQRGVTAMLFKLCEKQHTFHKTALTPRHLMPLSSHEKNIQGTSLLL